MKRWGKLWAPLLLVASSVAGLGGCTAVAVDRRGGFGEVAGIVKERAGREVDLDPTDDSARDRVRRLLENGLSADGAAEIALLENRELRALYSDLGVAQADLVQASLTRGRALQEGARVLRIHGQPITVRTKIETLDGLSAHADRDEILRWLRGFEKPPRRTYVVHGA